MRITHHLRAGEGNADQRSLQVNGTAVPHGPWRGAHEDFADPVLSDEPNDGDAYHGYPADGWWLEHGRRVPTTLTEHLGNDDYDLNSRKWSQSGDAAWFQSSDGIVIEHDDVTTFAMTGRFELRGDFVISLDIEANPAVGVGDAEGNDNAVWLGLSQRSDPSHYWRVKRCHFDGVNGVAAEVWDGAFDEGLDVAAIASCRLVASRVGATLTLTVLDGEDEYEVWSGDATGILVVDIGSRSVGGEWVATLVQFNHESGWHNYTPFASWMSERNGLVVENFVGDELDDRLWTSATDGAAEVVVGGDDGDGLHLVVTALGSAEVELVTITGDHTVVCDLSWARPLTTLTEVGTVDHPWRLIGRVAEDAEVFVDVGFFKVEVMEVEIVSTSLRIGLTIDGETTVVASNTLLPLDDRRVAVTVQIERRGLHWIASVVDQATAAEYASATIAPGDPATTPSHPVAWALRASTPNSGSSPSCTVSRFLVTTPHVLRLDAWPTDYYGATTLALAAELEPDIEAESPPVVCELTLIDLEQRPFWRMVGASDLNGLAFDQAMPGGRPGLIWCDYTRGQLWIPIGSWPTSGGAIGFVLVDLVADEIKVYTKDGQITFGGGVGLRQLGLGHADIAAEGSLPADGDPLYRARGGIYDVWVTRSNAKIVDDTFNAALVYHNDDELTYGETTITAAQLLPGGEGFNATLVILGTRRGDTSLAVYRDVAAVASEEAPGEEADALYTGGSPVAENADHVAGKLLGDADRGEEYGLYAIRPVGSLLPLIAVCRGSEGNPAIVSGGSAGPGVGLTVLQDSAVPADAVAKDWFAAATDSPIGIQGDADTLVLYPLGVRLTANATLAAGGNGNAFVAWSRLLVVPGPVEFSFGGVDVIDLNSLVVRAHLPLRTWDDPDTSLSVVTDPRLTAGGLILIEQPPGLVYGLRLAAGVYHQSGGIVEFDWLTITSGPWSGPHIGGTRFDIEGEGLEEVVGVLVGGVDCFRLRRLPNGRPGLQAVNRALGFIEHGNTPVMADEDLIATATWPKDVTLVFRGGQTIVIEDGFTYESWICIERTARRMTSRFPAELLDNDSKHPTWQRHILIAIAWLLCRLRERFTRPIEADTFRMEAIGEGLDAWAAGYGVRRPSGMGDDDFRIYALARAFGDGVTIDHVLTIATVLLGAEPAVEEGYRQFTLVVDAPVAVEYPIAYWGDPDEPVDLYGPWFDFDYWGGDEPLLDPLQRALFQARAAGIRGEIRVDDPE